MTFLQSIRALFSPSGLIDKTIVLEVRLPRTLLGLAGGGARSLAGVILQGLFRNPLVEPYTLGISGGAVLGSGALHFIQYRQYFGDFQPPCFRIPGSTAGHSDPVCLRDQEQPVAGPDVLLMGAYPVSSPPH